MNMAAILIKTKFCCDRVITLKRWLYSISQIEMYVNCYYTWWWWGSWSSHLETKHVYAIAGDVHKNEDKRGSRMYGIEK